MREPCLANNRVYMDSPEWHVHSTRLPLAFGPWIEARRQNSTKPYHPVNSEPSRVCSMRRPPQAFPEKQMPDPCLTKYGCHADQTEARRRSSGVPPRICCSPRGTRLCSSTLLAPWDRG